jgi:hypothetical protein
MPDKLIDIPGIGPVTFPESMTEDDINKAAGKLYADANPKHPPAAPSHSWVDTAVDWLPAVGGAAGGLVGGIGGTVGGVGVGGVPGALGGAALGGAGGEAFKQLINRMRGAAAPATPGDAALSIAGQGALQGGAEAAGGVIGAGMKMAAPRIMQAAVKPTMKMLGDVLHGAPVPRVVQTLLDEGVNVTAGGLAKLNGLLATSQQDLKALLAGAEAGGAPGVNPYAVTSRLGEVAQRAAQQVNPAADVATVGQVGNAFLDEYGGRTIPLSEANAIKSGTYQTLRKNYGALGSADIESQKALARGLKEEIEQQAPGADLLNRKIGDYGEAARAVGRRVAVEGNRDPVGFAWVAHNPQMFLAALMDRSPAVKSMIARGLYQSAGRVTQVSPQLIRAAVVALSTDAPGAAPAPE